MALATFYLAGTLATLPLRYSVSDYDNDSVYVLADGFFSTFCHAFPGAAKDGSTLADLSFYKPVSAPLHIAHCTVDLGPWNLGLLLTLPQFGSSLRRLRLRLGPLT